MADYIWQEPWWVGYQELLVNNLKLRSANRRIIEFASRLGIKFSTKNVSWTKLWDGECINAGGLRNLDICHEIAHWIIACPEQRKTINYGLIPEVPEHEFEEIMAQILGIWLFNYCCNGEIELTIFPSREEKYWKGLVELQKRKILINGAFNFNYE